METVLITIAGYALTVVFATTSVILANSLRHRRKELDAAIALQEAATSELIEVRSLATKRLNEIADVKEELKTCRDAATLLKAKNALLREVQDNLRSIRKKLEGAYKRDGKRFVKID